MGIRSSLAVFLLVCASAASFRTNAADPVIEFRKSLNTNRDFLVEDYGKHLEKLIPDYDVPDANALAAPVLPEEAAVVRPLRPNLVVEDLGSPVAFLSVRNLAVYRAPDSKDFHLFIQLDACNGFVHPPDPPAQFLDVNLETGDIRTATSGVVGGSGTGRVLLHPNGKLYIASWGRPAALVEFDTATGQARYLGNLTPSFYHSVQCLELGPDGAIYFGHYGRHASRYDPATGELRDFGPLDGAGEQYLYNIASDGRYIYGRMSHGWHLVVHDMQTGEQTVYRDLTGTLRRTGDGHIRFADRILQDGRPLPPDETPRPHPRPIASTELMDVKTAERKFGFEFDLAGVQPNNWNNGRIEVRWRRGQTDWRTAQHAGIDVVPNVPCVLAATPAGDIIGAGSGHNMPLFRFDPVTRRSQPLGAGPGHVYRILVTQDRAYFAAYRSQFWVYDLNTPWTLRATGGDYEPGERNPVNLVGPGMRTNLLALAADGRVFVAGNNERHRRGADLKILDPATGKQVSLRDELEPYVLTDMCAVNQGRAIVWSAAHRTAGTVNLFVYDVAERRIGRRLEVALPASGWMIPLAENIVMSVVGKSGRDKANQETHETVISKLDIRTGEVLLSRRVPGLPFTGPDRNDQEPLRAGLRELVKGPDGCAWLFIDRNLTRIHPDGTVESVIEMNHGGRVLFVGADLYIYGSGRQFFGGFSQILRIACPLQEEKSKP